MAETVTIDQLAVEITQAIADYTDDVVQAIEVEVEATANAVLEDIKANAPKRTGEYARGWSRRKSKSSNRVTYIVHNTKRPQLAHLLEHGHAKKGGGRVEGKPHIRPAVDRHLPAMEQRIKQIIERGGAV